MTRKKKTTVLFVDQALSFGGSIVVLGSLIDGLDKTKFRPIVIGEMDKSILNYHTKDQASIYVVPRLFNYSHWEKAVKVVSRIKPRLLFKLVIYLMSGIRSFVNVLYVLRIARIIIKERVDLIHVNNGMSNLEPVLVALMLKRNFIIHFHGPEEPGLLQKFLLNKVDKYVVISKYLRASLIESGYPEKRMIEIPNPVQETHALSTTNNNFRDDYQIGEDDKIFGIVGRIVRWKGHIEFLKATFLILEEVHDAKALIVGDFSDGDSAYQEKIQQMIDESGFSDRVLMTGYVKDISGIYPIMDVCVHASVEPEPFGLVIVEAMANGVAVVAANTGAPKEIITDKVNGYIVAPEKTTELANTIIDLLTDTELRKEIGLKGQEHINKNYNVNDYARSMEQVYIDVLDKTKSI